MTTKAAPAAQLQPVFIVSTPRSGSSLLFQTMETARDVFTIGGESHNLIEGISGLHPRDTGWSSNRLVAADATPRVVHELVSRFTAQLRDREGRAPRGPVVMIEKTPKNSLRVPFLTAAFPEARFVYLYRDPRDTMASMIEAWRSGRFRTYPLLPDWQGLPWSLLLVPGWRELNGLSLPEIVAHQWSRVTKTLTADLAALTPGRVTAIDYQDFIAAPQAAIADLCARTDITWDRSLAASLPYSPTVVSPPRSDKWRGSQKLIESLMGVVEAADHQARTALGKWRNEAALSRSGAP